MSNTLRKCKVRIHQPGVLRLTKAPPHPHQPWSECAGVSGCRCDCTGMSSHRCEGGGTGTPELPGLFLREGKLQTGSIPTAKCSRPGSSADTSKCSSTSSPSPHAPACPAASGPDASSLKEHEPLLVLGSGIAATGCRLRTPGWGPKAVVERWAPRALTPLPAQHPSTARVASVSVGATWTRSPRARVFVTGRCSRGAQCWGRGVHVGRGGSAGVKRSLLLGFAWLMGAHSSGILF